VEKIFNDDIKVKINRLDNKETLLDGEFATTYIINLDRYGQMTTSFYGLYNKDILKAIDNTSKKYIKKLKNVVKKESMLEECDVDVKKDEEIPEKQKLKENTSVKKKCTKIQKQLPEKSATQKKDGTKKKLAQKKTSK